METSSGIILPDDYITAMAAAAREVGALMVLDCIASGCVWLDMAATGVDVLISAPQKGWSASPSAGIVVMGPRAEDPRGLEATVDADAGDGELAGHEVEEAGELGGEVEVLGGLSAGDEVVVDGAFLLKAEADKARGAGGGHDHH